MNRARIESYLHLVERLSVEEWAWRRGIAIDNWPKHPAARGWVDLAIGRAVDVALSQDRASSYTKALELVCSVFELNPDSVARRWRRSRRTLCPLERGTAQKPAVAFQA